MNYTENYHLPQWEETDRIMRTDFNQMCADMEEGLNANAQAAADALAAANSKPTSSAVSQAQSTANQAFNKAVAAQATADAAYSPSYQPYVTGSYTGTGYNNSITVTLGFKPKFLIVTAQPTALEGATKRVGLIGEGTLAGIVTFTSTGFTISGQDTGYERAYINELQAKYRYIAFR